MIVVGLIQGIGCWHGGHGRRGRMLALGLWLRHRMLALGLWLRHRMLAWGVWPMGQDAGLGRQTPLLYFRLFFTFMS